MADNARNRGDHAPRIGGSPWLYALRDEFTDGQMRVLQRATLDGVEVSVLEGRESLWLVVRWLPQSGGVVVRTAYCPGGRLRLGECREKDGRMEWEAGTVLGQFRVRLEFPETPRALVHYTVSLTPDHDLIIPYWPVDVVPVDAQGDPLATRGIVHAGQRGSAAGVMFMSLTEPECGSLLYLQNLTALNDYCEILHVAPDARVGGSWPELGWTPPVVQREALPAGREVVISDALLRFTDRVPENPQASALLFAELLAEVYRHIPHPPTRYRDWPDEAEAVVGALSSAPACRTEVDGHHFLNGYVGTGDRRPESMVQLTVLAALHEYQEWRRKPIPLIEELKAGLPGFYDPDVGCVLRYLKSQSEIQPTDRDERTAWEIDSWYLYHPLANLARLALRGDDVAKRLLLDSVDYAVRTAQHFDYRWPIFFDAKTLEVTRSAPLEGGETDVGGLYAYLMLLVRDLTGDARYLEEAKRGALAMQDLRFNMGYQFNNTAWGANACLRLWQETGDEAFLGLSHVCLAGILNNAVLWECRYGFAKHYTTFFGITAMYNAAYLAVYEEHEIHAAFHEYLSRIGEEIPHSLRGLLAEYCKYALDRIWCYYPGRLPREVLATEIQNGVIDPSLPIPLEDIYEGWKQAGAVGQEVYGAGAPLALVARAYHRLDGAPFMVYSAYPLRDLRVDAEGRSVSFLARDGTDVGGETRLLPSRGRALPQVKVRIGHAGQYRDLPGECTPEGHLTFDLPGESTVEIEWQD
ncbi:MAG: hypothetical protein GX785_02265 [Armatimonadetes bacterium]|nr:hypothetical protein [Armatimonadota bacterium]